MIYLKKQQLSEVNNYYVDNNGLLIQLKDNKENMLILFSEKQEIIWQSNLQRYSYEMFIWDKDLVLVRLSDASIKVFSKGRELILKNTKGLNFYPIYKANKTFILFDDSENIIDTDWQFGVYDYLNDKILWKYHNKKAKGQVMLNDMITDILGSKLTIYSLLTGNYEWELDLSSFKDTYHFGNTITQIIGTWEHQLLISLNHSAVLSIDLHTGQILYDWKYEEKLDIPYDYNGHIDKEQGKLYFLKRHGFVAFDLATQKLSRTQNFLEGSWQNSWDFGNNILAGDYLYSTANLGAALRKTYLIVFHIPTMEIVWHYHLDNGETFNQAPQVSENKLYALDSGGTLHIFEKEG